MSHAPSSHHPEPGHTLAGLDGPGASAALRLAGALACIRGAGLSVLGARASEQPQGLSPADVAVLRGLGAWCQAKLSGVHPGATAFNLVPQGPLVGRDLVLDLGPTGLVGPAALPLVLALSVGGGGRIRLEGPTAGPWGPDAHWFGEHVVPALGRLGVPVRWKAEAGLPPEGQGGLWVAVGPRKVGLPWLGPERGRVLALRGRVLVAGLPALVAEQGAIALARALKLLGLGASPEVDWQVAEGPHAGAGLVLNVWLEAEGGPSAFSAYAPRGAKVADLSALLAQQVGGWWRSGAATEAMTARALFGAMLLEDAPSEVSLPAQDPALARMLGVARALVPMRQASLGPGPKGLWLLRAGGHA